MDALYHMATLDCVVITIRTRDTTMMTMHSAVATHKKGRKSR